MTLALVSTNTAWTIVAGLAFFWIVVGLIAKSERHAEPRPEPESDWRDDPFLRRFFARKATTERIVGSLVDRVDEPSGSQWQGEKAA